LSISLWQVRVRVREYAHMPASWDFRGGETSGDHVDIMGNREMISDVLQIAAGAEIEDKFVSDVQAMSRRVKLPASVR